MLKRYPLFIYLLPVFFYLFAISNYGLHPTTSDLLLPFVIMIGVAGLIHFLLTKFTRNSKPLQILFFLWYLFYLFFGNIKEAIPESSFFYSYYVLCPLLFLFPILFFLWMKKRFQRSENIFSYLNSLLIILCGMQGFYATKNIKASISSYMKPVTFTTVSSSSKPSIYFILFDEYPGQISLKHYHQFENTDLLNHLRANQFYVFDTINSNYDKTIFSVNSTLNMQYIDMALYKPLNHYSSYMKNFLSIRSNAVTGFLETQGYVVKNLSLFGISDHETRYSFPLLHTTNENLQRTIFHEKIKRDLLWKLYVGTYRMNYFYNKYLLHTHHQNNEIMNRIKDYSSEKHNEPFFLTAHLLLPHEPVFTDSTGKLYNMEFEYHSSDTSKKAFEYLKYTNRRMMELSDDIVKNDPDAIIILYSDHGYRDTHEENRSLYCNNFLAIHLPDSNYSQIKNIHSNVNLFRVLFDQYFDQHLPLLKDSSFSIDEEKNRFTQIYPF